MLEFDNGKRMMDDLWELTATKVVLSDSIRDDFLMTRGPVPAFHDNRRMYHRFYMRGKAVLKRGQSLIGSYTKDVSRQGIAFLAPMPLLPKERVKLRVPAAELNLEVTRCRRLDQDCFECGAMFILEQDK